MVKKTVGKIVAKFDRIKITFNLINDDVKVQYKTLNFIFGF